MTKRATTRRSTRQAFDVEKAIPLLREAVAPHPKAALFELAAEGYDSVFEQLVACIVSIRTLDEVTLPVARRLFAQARTPAQVAALPIKTLDELIHASRFHEPKSRTIHGIASRVVKEFDGQMPCDSTVLQSFFGVGPKCAGLALGIACHQDCIAVDVHVHRVTNRWGYVQTKNPVKTMVALQEKLPVAYWIELNALLVPFGKHVCTGHLPKCSTCPLLSMCQQVGVSKHR